MKFITVLLAIGFSSQVVCFGQEMEQKKYGFKLYSQIVINKEEMPSVYSSLTLRNRQFHFLSPAFAVYLSKGNFHELSIADFHISKTSGDYVIHPSHPYPYMYNDFKKSIQSFSLSYEYNFTWVKDNESKFQPFIGLSLDPSFYRSKYIPLVPHEYVQVHSTQKSVFSLIPRINYELNEKWLLDFNFKGELASISRNTSRNENPGIPIRMRKVSSTDLTYFPSNYVFRLGACYRF